MWRSIRVKLVIVYLLLLLFALQLIGAYVVRTFSAALIHNQTVEVQRQAQLLATLAAPAVTMARTNPAAGFTPVLSSFPEFVNGAVYLLSAQGVVIDTTAGSALVGQKRIDSVVTQVMVDHKNTTAIRFDPINHAHVLAVAVPIFVRGTFSGVIEYVAPIEQTYQTVRQVAAIFYTGSAIALLLTACLGVVLSRTMTRPILDVIRQTRNLAGGDFSKRVAVSSDDEFGDLALAVNDLTDKLEEALSAQERLNQARRDFVANVSHELRTPLTSIKSYIEALQDGADLDLQTRAKFLDVIAQETNRMVRLTRDLLHLTGLETGTQTYRKSIIDVRSWLEAAMERFLLQAKTGNVTFTLGPVQDGQIQGDRDMLDRVLDNILSNAFKYTGPEGEVKLMSQVRQDTVEIVLKDNGIGIPKSDLPHVFERFYRVDKARSRRMGGSGLGLALAREITERHGGRIAIDSELNQGTTVTVTLPLYKGVAQ